MRIVALNAGSSSLKAAVRDRVGGEPSLRVHAERVGTPGARLIVGEEARELDEHTWDAAVAAVVEEIERRASGPDVVVHRVVHGGPHHRRPVRIDDAVVAQLHDARRLAPLHQPLALKVIAAARLAWPEATHVACFDTGFHAELPEEAQRLPVSDTLRSLGIRRYGFHGLSVQSVLAARPELVNVVVAHLGNGCSVTAVGPDRRPRHTSMSFSPDSGMVSSTRSGDLDPEILLYLIDEHGYSTAELREELNHRAGLSGISGGVADVRDLTASTDPAAGLAVDIFVSSAAMAVAAAATTLDPWRSLVFTGGTGEHRDDLRRRICDRLRLGDDVEVMVVPADEELVMDQQARQLLG